MLPLIVVALRLNLSSENRLDFLNRSKTVPAFGFLHSHYCGHCQRVYPSWSSFATQYENDTALILAECDCQDDKETCNTIANVTAFPTFFVIFKGQYMRVFPQRDVAHFIEEAENLKAFDPAVKCERYFAQGGDYPLIAISFPDEDVIACERLLSIGESFPAAQGKLQLAKRSPGYYAAAVSISKEWQPNFARVDDFEGLMAFVKDHLQVSFGDEGFKVNEYVTVRKFGFFVFGDEMHVTRARMFGVVLSDDYFFAMMNVSEFREKYPVVVIQDVELPAFGILNREKTRFKLVKEIDFGKLPATLKALINITDPEEFNIPFVPPPPPTDEPRAIRTNIAVPVAAILAIAILSLSKRTRLLLVFRNAIRKTLFPLGRKPPEFEL